MSNLKTFKKQINNFSKDIEKGLTRQMRLSGLRVFTGVVKKTPVDTGRARSAWTLGINRKISSPESISDNTLTALATLKGVKPFDEIVINNSLTYIEFLENGSSKQAPKGMAAITVSEEKIFLQKGLDSIGRSRSVFGVF